MKIAIIGAGSSYTPELLDGVFERLQTIPVQEIMLMDPSQERLAINAEFARRMAARRSAAVAIRSTQRVEDAVKDAAFVITQIRVGHMAARIADEKLGLRHNLIGQETTGIGGFACALRTIPRILEIAHHMERLAPKGFLINFTNPAGIITEAVLRHSTIRTVGLCNIPIGMIMEIVRWFGGDVADVALDYVGLNHLSWVRRVWHRGKDITSEALAKFWEHAEQEWDDAPTRENMLVAMKSLGMFCNYYLQYYYSTETVLQKLKAKPKTRGEEVVEIEERLFAKYKDPSVTEKPEELGKRGGAHYSTAAFHLMDGIFNNRRNRQIVCCRNNGAVPMLDNDASVEVSAWIDATGAHAIPQSAPEPAIRGLMQLIKAYESLTVEAAVSGDREKAFQALLLHPLLPPSATQCRALLDEVLEINRPYLSGTFFKS